MAPFLRAGLAADEPTILAVGEACAERLADATRGRDDLIVVPASEEMHRPAVRLQTLQRAIDVHLAAGAERVRLVSSLPVDPDDPPALAWQPWARFEAYLDLAFADTPLWQLCLYDRRTAGEAALAHALRCHSHLATIAEGHQEVRDRTPALDLLAPLLLLDEVPGGPGEPVVELSDPSPAAARRAIAQVVADAPLDADDGDGLVSAVSEIVTNAHLHGEPPVGVCAWRDEREVVVTVTDHGAGPLDPTVGLAPARRGPGEGGFGLWIANQVCRSVTLHRTGGAFAVRMVARAREHG